MSDTVTIIDNRTGRRLECPVLTGTYGAPVIDTRGLYRGLGMFTLDPGYGTTASCRSAITYLDGDEGILLHRGYPIEQLAEQSTFLEVCYLLVHGDLPSGDQMSAWENDIKMHSMHHEIAMELERIALHDEYFIERRLYPNVDFYSGLIYQALKIPAEMFTVMVALARSAGWIAQWMELMEDPDFRIGRPRQLYTGPVERDYVPIRERNTG